jgi:hypothetical protein
MPRLCFFYLTCIHVSRAYDRTRGVSHVHCHKGRRHVSLAWACHWPSAMRSAALKQGWMPSATVLISPLPPQTQPFSISRRPSFLFLSITRTVCLHSTLWPRTLLTSSQRNSVISRPNKYNSTVYNPLVTLQNPRDPRKLIHQNACLHKLRLLGRWLYRQASGWQVQLHQHRRLQLLLHSLHCHVNATVKTSHTAAYESHR